MRRFPLLPCIALCIATATSPACGGGDDDDDDDGSLFPEVVECEGQAIEPLGGHNAMVISSLRIGTHEEALDLDGDGELDNQLAGLAYFVDDALAAQFAGLGLVLPLEFFDFAEPAPDECVKLAVYVGEYRHDADGDGARTAEVDGDCNDDDDALLPTATELAGNRIDDDCDGLADETTVEGEGGPTEQPSADTDDLDGDGSSLAAGDCDDTRLDVAPGLAEICGDGLDNDCDGAADWTGAMGDPAFCSPYDRETPDPLPIVAASLEADGSPEIAFRSARARMVDGRLRLTTEPAIFLLDLPVNDEVEIELEISGATLEGDLVMTPGGWALDDALLGGVIDVQTADRVRGIDVELIMLTADNSLLDAIFANIVAVLIGLDKAGGEGEFADCYVPDIDVDGDGLEIFCDSDPTDELKRVDVCVDADGTVVRDGDGGVEQCTDAEVGGVRRFQDGLSIALVLTTAPAELSGLLP